MNVNVNLAFLSLSILYIAFLNVIFLKKGHIKTFELDTFGKLITLNLIGILLEFGCIFTIKYSSSEILIEIVNRLFLLYLVTFVFLFSLYVFSISFDKANKKNNTLRMIIMLMYLFSVFLIFYLKLDIYNKNNIIYSYGPSTNVVYIISTICVILCFVSMIKNYKELKSKKYLPLFVFIIGGSVVALIQKINPALTLATSMEAYLLMIMYHTIENPDMKILEEVHRAKEISDNANEEKTMFLYNMTNEIRGITKDINKEADNILDETDNKKVNVEVIEDSAREIKGSTAKFTTITNEILDVSNMDGASIRVYDEKYNIKLILKSLINTYKKNLALRYNGKMQLNKWITISEDLVWKNTTSRSKETDNDAYTGPILSAVYMPASATIYNPLDGSYGGTTTEDPAYIEKYGSNFADAHGDAVNPVRLLEAENLYNKTSDVWSTTSLEIGNVLPGLKFVSRFTYNLQNYYYKKFNPIRDEVGKPNLSNNVQEQSYRMDAWKTENTLTYDNTFGKHTVGALFSTTADHYSKRGLEAIGKDLSSEAAYLQYMAYANSTEVLDYLTGPDANVSMIARLAYSYDDRYFVTASWRRDYAGRLPKEHNFGDFPAVTLGWKISNEKFFKKNDIVNLLKLRASWGRVGNLGSIDYNYKSPLLSKNTYSEQAQYGVTSNQLWNNFAYYSTALNPNLTWETSEQYDLGLDMEMFNNRLSLSMDYFDKRTFNLIQPQPMNWPSTMGLDAMLVNLGEVRNRGFELSIGWNDRINKNFSYFVTGNFSYLKNWVSDIGVKNEDGTPGVWTDDKSFRSVKDIYQTTEGEPLNSFHLIQTAGIFQSDEEAAAYLDKNGKRIQPDAKKGDLKFVDYDGDGTIGFGDRQYMGSATPKTTFAWTLGFTWKKLSFSAMFQGVGGAQAMNVSKYMLLSDVEGNFNRSREILNAWSPDNRGSNIPILSKNDNNGNFSTASDWYLEDASYLRLKNVTLSYDLSDVFCKWSHLNDRNSRLSVFLSGENLATITRYSGMDPECGGWDALKYPVSRVFSLGVKLTY